MPGWTAEELTKIGEADELELSSRRRDGSLRNPVTIWVVRLEDGLYVRSVKGRDGPWFRGTRSRREGRISAGGVEKDVTFADADGNISAGLDSAYRAKYASYPAAYVDSVVTPEARAATIKLLPA